MAIVVPDDSLLTAQKYFLSSKKLLFKSRHLTNMLKYRWPSFYWYGLEGFFLQVFFSKLFGIKSQNSKSGKRQRPLCLGLTFKILISLPRRFCDLAKFFLVMALMATIWFGLCNKKRSKKLVQRSFESGKSWFSFLPSRSGRRFYKHSWKSDRESHSQLMCRSRDRKKPKANKPTCLRAWFKSTPTLTLSTFDSFY